MELSYLEKYSDIPVTFSEQLDRCVELFPHRNAIIDQSGVLTWMQVRNQVDYLAAELIAAGVNPGDRILIGMERRFEIVIVFLAIARVGAISVPFNCKSTNKEKEELVSLVSPVGALFHKDLANTLNESWNDIWRIVVDSEKFSNGLKNAASNHSTKKQAWHQSEKTDTAYLNMTSGSTGIPRAATATYEQLSGNTMACVSRFNLTEKDIHLPLFAVMSHPHEIFCRALLTGASMVLIENLYPRTISEMIQQHKVTCIMAVSAVYNLLIPFLANKRFDFSSLRLPESGGMSTPDTLVLRFRELAGVPVIPVWGSTETMGVALAAALDRSSPPGSVGKVLPGYEARIVDKDNNVLGTGEIGELQLMGKGIMSGYWNNDSQTGKSFVDGWYRTGDLFEVDLKGNYFFRGRMDAMIKTGGYKIYPAELEAALFSHPLIREAVVVPFDDRLRGFIPLAVLVTEPGESLTEAQLRAFLKSRLSKHKMPRIFKFLPDLPRTASGKVDRKVLLSYSSQEEKPSEISLERRIAAIDLKILHLLNERMRMEIELMECQHDSAFQPEKSQETIQRILEFNPGPLHDSIVEKLFQSILSLRTLY